MKTKNTPTSQSLITNHRSAFTILRLRRSFFLIRLVLLCFAILPRAQAVVPAPDGGYPGGNTAEGQNALFSLSGGGYNTALGYFSLRSDTTGSFNTAIGAGTLLANIADENTATGAGALLSNTSGPFNTANGAFALLSNTTGSSNTAIGRQALLHDTTGDNNTATGFQALFFNTTGLNNTANGYAALAFNTGSRNTANGFEALFNNTTGSFNTANGSFALINNTTGSFNIALGYAAGASVTTADHVICIGTTGANVSNSCYIGSIAGQTVGAGGTTCYVDNDGKLGVILSARRFKTDITDMGATSEALLALHPVTFRYKPELDKTGIPQFGLVAEEVAKVNPDLVTHDAKGELSTVRYEAVNAMLLNEFLKEHRKVEEQSRKIHEQEASIAQLKASAARQKKGMEVFATILKEQASQIQKVSAQVEESRPALQKVFNND